MHRERWTSRQIDALRILLHLELTTSIGRTERRIAMDLIHGSVSFGGKGRNGSVPVFVSRLRKRGFRIRTITGFHQYTI